VAERDAGAGMSHEDASRLRMAAMRLARTLRAASAEEDLTPAQSGVLATLEREGPARAGDLATAEGLNPTMLSRVLAALEERGLTRRRPDPGDRRVAWVEVTPAGRRLVRRLRERRAALLCGYLDHLGADERAALARAVPALERLADVAASAPPGAPPSRGARP
jgi:DNA-binding MarR family transcriptional regulator